MGSSIHTNMASLVALQNLAMTNRALEETQGRVSSGLKIANAKDDGAIYNIAQHMRSEHAAFEAVQNGLSRAKAMADVALAAGESISDTLSKMKEKALAAMDPSISATSRSAYATEFDALRAQISSLVSNASYDGGNLLAGGSDMEFLANSTGTQTLTLPTLDLTPATLGLSGLTMTSAAEATAARSAVETAINDVNLALAKMGVAAKRVENHEIFVGKLQDAITGGIGDMVDADLSVESARLQALQVKQQLGTQALSIANQAPQSILSLFRN